MSFSGNTLLLSGIPGIGKTTLIKKAAASLADHTISGFYTEEIRSKNIRQGFVLVTLNGHRIVMAHVDSNAVSRVGKYGVDVRAIDRAVRMSLTDTGNTDLFIIDEIGKMECFSDLFAKKIISLLDSGKPVVATIAFKGSGFITAVKSRPEVLLWEITEKNRDNMVERVVAWVKERTW